MTAFHLAQINAEVMRRRREWFSRMAEAFIALWWVPAGHRPSVSEGVERLARLRADGPSPHAFTFRQQFPPEVEVEGFESIDLPGACPAV